jgi:HEPN domain-containing protein
MSVTRTNAEGQAEITLRWLRWADADYLGARLLLLNSLLVQGAALSTTAIEKYLKAICIHSGMKIPHSHDVPDLYKRVVDFKTTNLSLNESYLRLLKKSYKLRYPDDLTEGYNIALNQAKLLSALDRSVLEITKRFGIEFNGKTIPMVLDEAKLTQNQSFLMRNVAVDPSQVGELFSQPSRSYEMRGHKGLLYQVHYESLTVKDDPLFEPEGFKPQNDVQFQVAYMPMRDLLKPPIGTTS